MTEVRSFFIQCEGFLKRRHDLNAYFEFLKKYEQQTFFPSSAEKRGDKRTLNIHRAQAYMLAYNLIEYVFEALAEYLERYLRHPDLKFDMLLKKTQDWIFSFYDNVIRLRKGDDFSKEHFYNLVRVAWDTGERLSQFPKSSGNWNWEIAHKYFKNFGWSIDETIEEKWWYEPVTKEISKKRNLLAHGEESYSIIGSDITAFEIGELFQKSQGYLLKMVRSIYFFLKENTF